MRQPIPTTALDLARRFLGVAEVEGHASNPAVLAMLQLDSDWPKDDEIAWCSAFANYVCWLLDLPRSKSLAARSWLKVGEYVPLEQARAGFDVVVFKRGGAGQPGPDVIDAPGHVAFFVSLEGPLVRVVGGNQGDEVSVAVFPATSVLGVRRL